jgi:hypothetical protein
MRQINYQRMLKLHFAPGFITQNTSWNSRKATQLSQTPVKHADVTQKIGDILIND